MSIIYYMYEVRNTDLEDLLEIFLARNARFELPDRNHLPSGRPCMPLLTTVRKFWEAMAALELA